MKNLLQTLTLLLGFLTFVAPTASAQEVLDISHPDVQALGGDLELAQALIDYGAIVGVADPSLPSGFGVTADCDKLKNAFEIALAEETAAQEAFDEKQQAYEELVQKWNLDPESVTTEELDEAQKCADEAEEHLILVRSRVDLLLNLLNAFGC